MLFIKRSTLSRRLGDAVDKATPSRFPLSLWMFLVLFFLVARRSFVASPPVGKFFFGQDVMPSIKSEVRLQKKRRTRSILFSQESVKWLIYCNHSCAHSKRYQRIPHWMKGRCQHCHDFGLSGTTASTSICRPIRQIQTVVLARRNFRLTNYIKSIGKLSHRLGRHSLPTIHPGCLWWSYYLSSSSTSFFQTHTLFENWLRHVWQDYENLGRERDSSFYKFLLCGMKNDLSSCRS